MGANFGPSSAPGGEKNMDDQSVDMKAAELKRVEAETSRLLAEKEKLLAEAAEIRGRTASGKE